MELLCWVSERKRYMYHYSVLHSNPPRGFSLCAAFIHQTSSKAQQGPRRLYEYIFIDARPGVAIDSWNKNRRFGGDDGPRVLPIRATSTSCC